MLNIPPSSIGRRCRLPDGLRLILWPVVNLEVWEIERPMARQVLPAPTGVAVQPDVPNWSWHEYGMRVGVWRFFDAFDRHNIRPTLSINAEVVEIYPRVAAAARERRWEFMGHALVQMPIHQVTDQRAMIHRSLELLGDFTGARPKGWLGPGLTETEETPDLLAEAGVQYVGDFVHDDEPTELQTKHGPLVTLPYTVELNDIPMMMVQHHTGARVPQSLPATSSTGSMPRASTAPRFSASPSTLIFPARRIGSNISKPSSITRAAIRASPSGPARKSSIGIAASAAKAEAEFC